MNKRIERIPGIPVPGVKERGPEKEVIQELGPEDFEVLPDEGDVIDTRSGGKKLEALKEAEVERMQGVALDADPGILQRKAESIALLKTAKERAHALLTQRINVVQKPTNQIKPDSGIVGWIKGLFS